MFDKRPKKFLLFYLIFGLILFFLFQLPLRNFKEGLNYFSLTFQKALDRISLISFFRRDSYWQAKYFSLLRELGALKLKLQGITTSTRQAAPFPYQKVTAEILHDTPFGNIYLAFYPAAKEGDVVVDQNLVLLGRVKKVTKDYVLVEKITKPGLIFNLIDSDNNFLGIGETLANGFIEIKSPYLSQKPKSRYVFTGGGDGVFPKNLLVGEIVKQTKDSFIIRSLADAYFQVIILRP